MTSSLCPHLVQEYFQRVSDILTTYRPQILKQVEYDKISENLVLRGAVRQEEHQKIFHCANLEGQVSQMLVVIQNRMWGLENLLAAFMEEHISPWLTQELFRAYMEHLVNPLRKIRENPICQCVQLPNSILYRGWVKALKSLDSLILKTGTSLGFMKQTVYPTDNMLLYLSKKLAEYTGGDSCSSSENCHDDLVPYGFAPNTSGEVQVAELEEDDINDLISLSETLCIDYQNFSEDTTQTNILEDSPCRVGKISVGSTIAVGKGFAVSGESVVNKTVQKKTASKRTNSTINRSDSMNSSSKRKREKSTLEHETTDTEQQDKLAKQRELIARLSAPKSVKASSTATSSSSVRLRNLPSCSADFKNTTSTSSATNSPTIKQRPRSAEFHRSLSMTTSSSTICAPLIASTNTRASKTTPAPDDDSSPVEKKEVTATGKTQGFVRSKSHVPTSPKSKGTRLSSKSKPTAVAKPTVKIPLPERKAMQLDKQFSKDKEDGKENQVYSMEVDDTVEENSVFSEQEHHEDDGVLSDKTKLFNEEEVNNEEDDDDILARMLPEMSSLLLSKTILANGEEKSKSLAYYQLNFDSFSDDE